MSFSFDLLQALDRAPAATLNEVLLDGKAQSLEYKKLRERVQLCVQGLVSAGVAPGHTVAIRAANTIDFVVWDLACITLGAISHVFPETYSSDDTAAHLRRFDAALYVSDASGLGSGVCAETTLSNWDWGDKIRVEGAPSRIDKAQRPLSRVYSSGTTGSLKGLNISYAGVEFVINAFIKAYQLTADDSHLIFLPISNFQQRLSIYGCLLAGASVTLCVYQKVFEVARSAHPTFLIGPPAFYNIALTTQKSAKSSLFGERIRFLITGMSTVPRSMFQAFEELGIPLYDAYGLTETGMIAWNKPGEQRLGSVGKPLDRGHIKIDSDGEIVIKRATPLCSGYFDAPEDDKAATYRSDGIATGDLGYFDEDGYLFLRGRKKDAIVLSNGKKINPQEVELFLQERVGMPNIFVVGDETIGVVALVHGAAMAKVEAAELEAIQKKVSAASKELEREKWVSKVVIFPTEVQSDPRFLTRNMKINRNALKTLLNM